VKRVVENSNIMHRRLLTIEKKRSIIEDVVNHMTAHPELSATESNIRSILQDFYGNFTFGNNWLIKWFLG
jgi:hypothetical protein